MYILGIGDDGIEGLTATAKQQLAQAELILGPDRSLSMLHGICGKQIPVGSSLEELLRHIRQAEGQRVVVLQVGDPLFMAPPAFSSSGWARTSSKCCRT